MPKQAPRFQEHFVLHNNETGEPLVFNPSFLHAAWNDSEDVTRYVYNIAVSTGSFGSLKRLCAYNFTYVGASGLPGVDASAPRGGELTLGAVTTPPARSKKVGSYKIRYYSD